MADNYSSLPTLTQRDLQDPTLFRFNSVVSQILNELLALRNIQQQVSAKTAAIESLVAPEGVGRQADTSYIPGDVRPIGGEPFLISQTNLPGGEKAFDIEYDPPDPIGVFAGVYVVVTAPSVGGTDYFPGGDFQYNGDPNAADATRHGTLRVVMPTPEVQETWRFYLVSYASDYRKAFYHFDEVLETPSPNRTFAVDPAPQPSGDSMPDAETILGATAAVEYGVQESADGTRTLLYHIKGDLTLRRDELGAIADQYYLHTRVFCYDPVVGDANAEEIAWGVESYDGRWYPAVDAILRLKFVSTNKENKDNATPYVLADTVTVEAFPALPSIMDATVELQRQVINQDTPTPKEQWRLVCSFTQATSSYQWYVRAQLVGTGGQDDGKTINLLEVGEPKREFITDWFDQGASSTYQLQLVPVNRLEEFQFPYDVGAPFTVAPMDAAPAVVDPEVSIETADFETDAGLVRKYRFKGSWTRGVGDQYWFTRVSLLPQPAGTAIVISEEQDAFQTDWFDIGAPASYRVRFTPVNRLRAEATAQAAAGDPVFSISGISAAGNVRNCAAVVKTQAVDRPEGRVKQWAVNLKWDLPADTTDFGYCVPTAVFTVPGASEAQFTGHETEAPGSLGIDSSWFDLTEEIHFSIEFRTYNVAGDLAAGSPTFAGYVLSPDGVVTAPENVTLGTPQVRCSAPDASGKVNVLVTIPFTPPSQPGVWDHVMAYLSAPDDVPTTSKAAVGADGDVGFFIGAAGTASNIVPNDNPVPFGPFRATEPVISIAYPMPETAQVWRVRAPSGSTNAENALAGAPSVTFTVDPAQFVGPNGAEYAPNGKNFTANRTIQTTDGGNKTWGFDDSWSNPTDDPRYQQLGGYDVVIEYPDGRRETQDSPAKNRTTGSATGWTIPTTDQSYKVWLVSWDVTGRRNSIVAGVTPCATISIGPQVGAAGQEYAGLVSGLACLVAYSQTVDGAEQWTLTTRWANPSGDAGFAGGKIVLRPNSGSDQTLGYVGKNDTQAVWGPYNIGAPITYTPYFVSMDNNGRENTLVVGTTPTAAAFEIKAQTTGGIKANRIDPLTLNPTLGIVGGKLGVPDGALDIASFASTIRPPVLVPAKPTFPNALYPAGTIFYHTVQHKLYRVNAAGNDWQAAVGADDLIANCITAGQLAAGAVGTQQLYAGEILVGAGGGKPGRFKVVAAAGATAAWIGDDGAGHVGVYAKSLWVGPDIDHPQFYCDASGNATFAGTLSASVAVLGIQVSGAVAAATSASTVPGTGVTGSLAAGGSSPTLTMLGAYDAANALCAWIGKYGTDYGFWGRNVWIGGAGPSSAKIRASSDGSVVIDGAPFTMTGSGFTATINSTDGVKVVSGNYYALLNSGYFEAKYATNVNAHAKLTPFQFDLQADAGKYITMTADSNFRVFNMTDNGGILQIWMQSGLSGFIDVRQGAEYRVSGSSVINSSAQFVGAGVNTPGYGVACSGVNVNDGVQRYGRTVTLYDRDGNQMVFRGGALCTS
jgi:hypothetical protein